MMVFVSSYNDDRVKKPSLHLPTDFPSLQNNIGSGCTTVLKNFEYSDGKIYRKTGRACFISVSLAHHKIISIDNHLPIMVHFAVVMKLYSSLTFFRESIGNTDQAHSHRI